jgi:hypothetical protein
VNLATALMCKNLNLRFQSLSREIATRHSSLGAKFGERIDSVKDANLFCKSGTPDLPTMLASAEPVLRILDRIDSVSPIMLGP